MLSAHPFVCGENLLRMGKSAAKKGQKGQATGAGADRSSRICLAARVLGSFRGGNQFRVVCVGRLGCLFDKPHTCNLSDRRLFDKHQTCNLVDRRLFDKHQTCDLIDRCLFDKPRTRALINRCLFACGEAARSVSRGCLIAGIRERVGLHCGWPATGRLYGKGGTFGAGKETLSLLPL